MMWCFPVVWSLDRHRNLSVKLTAIRGVNKIRESVEPILRRTPPKRKTTLYRKTPLHCTGRPRGSDCRISCTTDLIPLTLGLNRDGNVVVKEIRERYSQNCAELRIGQFDLFSQQPWKDFHE